jgi:hypothetical protein
MYNFRYHLVTIVSIFAALAIGLLLGVAITGSELVKDTSNDMTASLMEQFDDLNTQNRDLSDQLAQEQSLRAQLFAGWRNGRLEGRTVVVLSAGGDTNTALNRALANTVSESGGIPVLVSISASSGLGTQDEQLASELHDLVPPIEGEDYTATVTRALANEWTFRFVPNSLSAEEAFAANYPLTTRLSETGRIEIRVDYRSVIDTLGEAVPGTANVATAQLEAYQLAQEQQLPYACNGLIDTVALAVSPGVFSETGATSLALASLFDQKGALSELAYLRLRAGQDALLLQSSNQMDNGNYYVVLVQDGTEADGLVEAAYEYDLPCVTSPFDPAGRYSIIALLSGAESGVYGLGREGVATNPPYPPDQTGRAPFVTVLP